MAVVYATRVKLADAVGLAVGDERVEHGEWRWLIIQPILWEAVTCLMFILFFSHSSTLLVICSDPRSHYLHMLAPMWNTSLQIFI